MRDLPHGEDSRALFPPTFLACGPVSVGFEPLLKTTRQHALLARSEKISYGVRGGTRRRGCRLRKIPRTPISGLAVTGKGRVRLVCPRGFHESQRRPPKDSCFTSPWPSGSTMLPKGENYPRCVCHLLELCRLPSCSLMSPLLHR